MNLAELSSLKQAIRRCKAKGANSYHETGLARPILSRQEINNILTDMILIEKNSFKVVKNSMYENYDMNNDPIDEINRIQQAFNEGNTVVAKNLETYNLTLDLLCQAIGNNVDAHMYMSPKDACGFPLHSDDRSVFIFMLYGEKLFKVEDKDILLEAGDMLYIKQGIQHKATAVQASCHISFGLAEQYLCDYSNSLPIPLNLPF
jgi:ribosomal protein L16 Arg81 hydroxylase